MSQLEQVLINLISKATHPRLYRAIQRSRQRDDVQDLLAANSGHGGVQSSADWIVREFSLDEVTILLVEDDAKLRPAVARLLTQSGYRVLQARSGEEALAILGKDPTGVDLVITDLVMPTMSGRELSERIVAAFPGIPILFTSGYTDDLVIRQGLVARGLPFVQKPFTRDEIIAAIEGALAAT